MEGYLVPDSNFTVAIAGFSTIDAISVWSYVVNGRHRYLKFTAGAATSYQCYVNCISSTVRGSYSD
jgi:hypothetical protein